MLAIFWARSLRAPQILEEWQADPQTSAGLQVSCEAQAAPALVARIRAAGYPLAQVVGTVLASPEAGPPQVRVRA